MPPETVARSEFTSNSHNCKKMDKDKLSALGARAVMKMVSVLTLHRKIPQLIGRVHALHVEGLQIPVISNKEDRLTWKIPAWNAKELLLVGRKIHFRLLGYMAVWSLVQNALGSFFLFGNHRCEGIEDFHTGNGISPVYMLLQMLETSAYFFNQWHLSHSEKNE